MLLGVKGSAACAARMLRRALLARGSRRYTAGAVVVLMAVFGTAAAAAAIPGKTTQSRSRTSPTLAGFRQGAVSVAGCCTIHYVIGGSGPALVLLHGWPETWWEWHKVMPSLASDHTVIAFDLPGLGDSSVPASGFTAVTTAQRLRQAVLELGFDHVELMAHDLGVLIAYAYARDFPGTVTRLAVLDSELNGFGLESIYGLSFHFLFNMAPAPTPENMVDNQLAERTYLNYMFAFAQNPAAIDGTDRSIYYAAYSSPAHREAGYDYFREYPQNEANNLANASETLTMPVLAMGGEDSFGPFTATSFEHVASDVHEVVAPGSGHFIPEEVPAFLSACAGLFFSSSPNPHPPSDLTACLP